VPQIMSYEYDTPSLLYCFGLIQPHSIELERRADWQYSLDGALGEKDVLRTQQGSDRGVAHLI